MVQTRANMGYMQAHRFSLSQVYIGTNELLHMGAGVTWSPRSTPLVGGQAHGAQIHNCNGPSGPDILQ